jgi:hypothetical protein
MTPHPQTTGVYGKAGTVQGYLENQGLAPFFDMSERYGKLYQRMVDVLEKLDPDELDRRSERRAAVDELPAGTIASMWVDVDATIDSDPNTGDQVSIDGAVDRHIKALEAWLAGLES